MSDQNRQPRFVEHLRTGGALSRRTALFGLAGAGAVFLAGCGSSSEMLSGSSTSAAGAGNDTASSTATTTSDGATTTGAAAGTATSAAASSGAVAASQMAVDFTYQMGSGGKQANPYIAVWVEDSSGALVDTVAVWFEQGGKGSQYLKDLTDWYNAASGSDYSTASGATRAAGTYSVAWSGPDGAGIPAGDYTVYIESAREHGSISLISQALTVSGPATVACTDDGELSAASITLS